MIPLHPQDGICRYRARPLRRIHDEDGATIDIVSTNQFGAEHSTVVYKTYELDSDDLALMEMVTDEVGAASPAGNGLTSNYGFTMHYSALFRRELRGALLFLI